MRAGGSQARGDVFGQFGAVTDVAIRPATTSVSGNRHAMRNGGAANLDLELDLELDLASTHACARGHLRGGPGIAIRRERYGGGRSRAAAASAT